MQEQNKVIVFRSLENGSFLESYKNRDGLNFKAEYCCLDHALKLPLDMYEEDKETYDTLAKAFECEILVVNITYDLKTLDGSEPKEIDEEDKVDELRRAVSEVFAKALFGGGE